MPWRARTVGAARRSGRRWWGEGASHQASVRRARRVGAETPFFFQAEDGIRDYKVTGVQTCALPISFEGAVFDLLVELYERRLVTRGMIARGIAEHSTHTRGRAVRRLHRAFARAFARHRDVFRLALAEARDYLGLLLARTWQMTPMTDFAFSKVVTTMLAADQQMGGRNGPLIRAS